MAVKEFGMRELRNNTNSLLDALDSGHQVFITRRGARVAELRVPEPVEEIERLLADAEELPGVDSGMYDELFEAKDADVAAQSDRCLLYTSDAADERSSVDLGGRRIIKKKTSNVNNSTGITARSRR